MYPLNQKMDLYEPAGRKSIVRVSFSTYQWIPFLRIFHLQCRALSITASMRQFAWNSRRLSGISMSPNFMSKRTCLR